MPDRYVFQELVRRGGQGEVWRALDSRHGDREVALKVRRVGPEGETEALRREARVLLDLRHDNLPIVRDDFFSKGRLHLVMDWVEGTDLQDLVDERREPLHFTTVLRYIEQAAAALEYLHHQNPPVVHGDVKPANLMERPDGSVVLVDLGIADQPGEATTGTSGYTPVEGLTPATDVYGLATTAYALLTGERFEGQPRWDSLPGPIASAVERALRPALSSSPERRGSASELAARLRAAWREADLPTGTVTFLVTEATDTEAGRETLRRRESLLREAVESRHGRIAFEGRAVFHSATDAVAAALGFLGALDEAALPAVRMALDTGDTERDEGTYRGPTLDRCLRLRALAHPKQVLVSQSCGHVLRGGLPAEVTLRDLGAIRAVGPDQGQHVFQLVAPDLPHSFPPIASVAPPPPSLPVQLTNFVGRERERSEVADMLTEHRLVTITGAAGVGKTRLAIALLTEADRKAAFVDLEAIADPSVVVHAVAKAVGVQEGSVGYLTGVQERQEPPFLERLADVIGSRQLLLALDNCEHLLDACTEVVDRLVHTCERLTILCTSRAPLGLDYEATYRLPPLGSEAVALFLDRAEHQRRGLRYGDEDLRTVLAICERLDGLPYDIELAATWVAVLSPAEILDQLGEPLRLLTSSGRTARPERQSSRAMIALTYQRLSDAEQALLRRLAVFRGSFGLQAVQQVCGDPALLQNESILDLLSALVRWSLVEPEPSQTVTRYRLLETTWQFAGERLAASGEEEALRSRHRRWYVEFAERAEPRLEGADQVTWLGLVDLEQDNLQVALEPDSRRGASDVLRIAAALGQFWLIRGYLSEGRGHLDRALAADKDAAPSVRAKALAKAGILAMYDGDLDSAKALSSSARSLAREHDEARTEALALVVLAMQAQRRAELDEAEGFAEASVAIARSTADDWALALGATRLAALHDLRGELAQARAWFSEALALSRRIGDAWGLAGSLFSLAGVLNWQAQPDGAEALLDECLALAGDLGSGQYIVLGLRGLGDVAWFSDDPGSAQGRYRKALEEAGNLESRSTESLCVVGLVHVAIALEEYAEARGWVGRLVERNSLRPFVRSAALQAEGRLETATGNFDAARRLHREALDVRRGSKDAKGIVIQLEELASVAADEGEHERAVTLLGATLALRTSMGAPVPPLLRPHRERTTAHLRTTLDPARFTLAWQAGQDMSLDQAVEFGLA